jgi:NADPH2:quinone reductase
LDVGADAGDFRVGDRVVAYTQTGGYAEVVAVPRHRAVAIPPGVAYDEAVAVVLNYVTARQMLRRVAGVRAGNVVLVQGAAGGVGTALLELGKLEGLRIYGTVSPAKLPMVEGLGAIPIDYRARDFVAEVRRAEPSGLDAAFESVSIENAYRSRSLLRPRGTLVYYGFVGMVSDPRYAGKGLRLGLDLARLRLSQGGTRTRIYAIDADRRKVWFREDLEAVLHLLREDRIHPVIQATYPLERAGEAHELLLSGGVAGKILLDCSG